MRFFSKDSEKSAAGEICRLEGRQKRKIVSPPLVGMSNFYNDFDNFFKGRSSSMARPGQECSEIPKLYSEKMRVHISTDIPCKHNAHACNKFPIVWPAPQSGDPKLSQTGQ